MSDKPETAAPDLSIRARPRPVKRFSKPALAALLGSAGLVVMLTAMVTGSLGGGESDGAPRELYSTENKPTADGLSALPASYGEVGTEPAPDRLGPPLPGDLGGPMLRAEREGRIEIEDRLGAVPAPQDGDDIDQAAIEAARQQREALEAARSSDLFFTNRSPEGRGLQGAGAGPGFETASLIAPENPFLALGGAESPFGASLAEDPNRQARKLDFLNGDGPDAAIYNPHRLQDPVSPYQVMAGTVIPATLLTGVNSDLPGQVIAQVTEPVYDTVTGEYLLIPQGTRVVGRYDSVIAYGQSRALIVWSRLVFPDGTSLRIENLPGVNARGQAGLSDRIDHHTLRIFSAAALSSLISIGAELGEDDDDDIARALREATQDGASRVGDELVRRQLNVQPTLTIRPGWRFRILVHQDLILRPYGDPS